MEQVAHSCVLIAHQQLYNPAHRNSNMVVRNNCVFFSGSVPKGTRLRIHVCFYNCLIQTKICDGTRIHIIVGLRNSHQELIRDLHHNGYFTYD